MHPIETKHKFIELRARNLSLSHIAQELDVDKNVLTRWNREFAARIHNLQQIELENLYERLLGSRAERLQALARDYHRYSKELETRDPARIPHPRLFNIVSRLRDQVERRITPPEFLPESDQQPNSPEVTT